MVTAQMVKGLAARLEKAQQLVTDGAVFPVAGLDDYAVVRNGDGSQMYLVEHRPGHERCSCPDFQRRQKSQQLPCKHILAAQLASAPQSPAVVDAEPDWTRRGFMADPAIGIAILTGTPRRAA